MRKEKRFEIEGIDKSLEVYELRVKQIISLMEEDALGDLSLTALRELLSNRLLPLCSNIAYSDLIEMAPSEIQECWTHFREVNASFFVGMETMGLSQVMERIKLALINDFSNLLVDSSRRAIPKP